MSIQTYNKQVLFDERLVPQGGEIPPIGSGVAMEFQVTVMTTTGKDKTARRSSTYTVVGSGEGGNATYTPAVIADLLDAGARMASNIAYMSKGVISGFFAKLGKYRNDEEPIDVPVGDSSYAIVDMCNCPDDEYGLDVCERSGEHPVEYAQSRIFIPWLRDDISRQDVIRTLTEWNVTKNGIRYTLGQVKFNNVEKSSMTAYPCETVRNITIRSYSRKTPAFRQNNDTHQGIEQDQVASELYNTFDEGVDDTND